MAQPTLNIPMTFSYDTRGIAAYAAMTSGRDQRRVNCEYSITRTAVDTQPDISVSRRPGVTVDAGTYGTATQVPYLVARDPASTWNQTAWAIVKNGNANNVVTSASSATLLTDANYYPRFWEVTNVNGTNNLVVVLQNSNDPAATPSQKIYATSTTVGGFAELTDADLTGLSLRGAPVFMDGFMFVMDSRNRIYQSNINSLTAWTSTDFLTKSTTLDSPQGLAKIRNQIIAFGTDTVEIFRNEGNATGSVLSRIPNSEHRIGLGAVAGGGSSIAGKTQYYVAVGDWIFFIGRYGGSKDDASLIAYDGNRFEKISRPHEDTLLSSTPIYSVNKVTISGKVAVAIQLTAPGASPQRWLMFFPDINEFFEWDSTVFSPVNNGLHYAGVADTTKLYTFDATDKWQDAGSSFDMIVQFKLPFGDLQWKSMSHCGLIGDSSSSSQVVTVAVSDDNGANFVTKGTIDMSVRRKEIYRMGTFKERMVRLTHSGTGEVRLRRFYAGVI